MDSPLHDMRALFLPLGLPDQPEDIQAFIETHRRVPQGIPLPEADFWTPAQAAFLREAGESSQP